jgi:rod shape-determining protein MreC
MNHRALFSISFLLIGLLSFSPAISDTLRGGMVAHFSPYWKELLQVKFFLGAPFHSLFSSDSLDAVVTKDQEIQRLLLENQLLGNEISFLKEVVEHEHSIVEEVLQEPLTHHISKGMMSKHQKETMGLFELKLIHLPARVIFRPVNAWNSSLWIDKGEEDNQVLGRNVIQKNSPVVVGTSIVGVVDYVGKNESRVRLITDSGLNPSVRIKRGAWLLAKGELRGEAEPLARSHRSRILGTGFNYDFADVEGPARDLRTGEPLEKNSKFPTMPLVLLNDLLITTGMDGVFPPGLEAGIVKKIQTLKEGDFAWDLEAESTAGDLNSLMVVFILPPLR